MKRFLFVLLAVLLIVAMAVPTFASEFEVPYVNVVWDSATYPYAVVALNSNGQYWLTVSTSSFTLKGSDKVESTGAYQTYKLNSSNTWVYQSTGNGTVSAGWNEELLYSNHDILSELGGNVYFSATLDFFNPPPPLAEVVMGITEETLQEETLPEVVGTMKVLVLCGVGLIASLAVLSLFGKRSLISLR